MSAKTRFSPSPGRFVIAAVALAALSVLVVPTSASATTAELSGQTLLVTADAGEHNDLVVSHVFAGDPATSQFYITEQSTDATMTIGAGCTPDTSTTFQAYCPTAGITAVEVRTLDLADKAFIQTNGISPSVSVLSGMGSDEVQGGDNTGETIDGGKGHDVLMGGGFADVDPMDILIGGPGRDKLEGQGGVDKLKAKDGERDKLIDCGTADDRKAKRDRSIDPKPVSC